MAILTGAEFEVMFGVDRIHQLASDLVSGRMTYVSAIVDDMLVKADGLVKVALTKQYSVAEIEADAGVQRITGDIAYYYLEFRRGKPPTEVIHLHNLARAALKSLQDGVAKLADVAQLLPIGETEESTEATDSGFFD